MTVQSERERQGVLSAAGKPTGGFLLYLGRNTYAVMMHHIMAFMLVKAVLAGIAAHTGYLPDFDFVRFYADIDYSGKRLGGVSDGLSGCGGRAATAVAERA